MKCPACGRELTPMTAGDITVDVCDGGCGGIWFDNFEFEKVDDREESAGEALLDIKRDPNVQVDHEARRMCPKCDNIVMMRHFASIKRQVEVDECPACGGIWLDYGELAAIREQFTSQEEKQKATKEYFDEIVGQKLKKMAEEDAAKAEKARRLASMFRFICPSYYIPGKQDWGAF